MSWRSVLAVVAAFLVVPLVMLAVARLTQAPLAVLVVLVVVAAALLARPVTRWAGVGWSAGSLVWVAYASTLAGNLDGSG